MEPELGPPTLLTPPAPRRGRRRAIVGGLAVLSLATGALVNVAPWAKERPARIAALAKPVVPAPTATTAAPTTTAPAVVEVVETTTTTTPAPPPTTAATAPPATVPRVPRVAAAATGMTFDQRLEHAMAGTPGCLVVEQDGAVIYERNPTTPFVPASSQKLMVGIAVLGRLGPDFRFETKVVAPAKPGDDGRLDDAWLVGGGDPYLATPDYMAYAASKPRLVTLPLTPMTTLADALVAAGVRDLPDGLHGDESRHDTQRSVPTWKPSYVREAEVGSLGALTVNEGLASFGPSQAVAPDPAAGATQALTALLQERGVTAAPPGPAPDGRTTAPRGGVVVASVRSAPLSSIVAAMLRTSDNYAAEMLLRELDRQTGGVGSTAGGAARVVEEMAGAGVAVEGVHLNDGSGLDLGNRSTCRALLGALTLTSRPELSAVAEGLAVAGRSGTLLKRFLGTAAEGRLAAKTGWLSGAAALVGRLDGAPGAPARRFALVVNGNFNWPTASALEDRVVEVLAIVP
jgi:D-alanyl-D-alanine carboxypeptidase/D-alanyl-D-alanine-endopeptidase (penicillin-binding protein 4)